MKNKLIILLTLSSLSITIASAQWLTVDTGNGFSFSSSPWHTSLSTPYIKGTYIKKSYFPIYNYISTPYLYTEYYDNDWDDDDWDDDDYYNYSYGMIPVVVPRVRTVSLTDLFLGAVYSIPVYHHMRHAHHPRPHYYRTKWVAPWDVPSHPRHHVKWEGPKHHKIKNAFHKVSDQSRNHHKSHPAKMNRGNHHKSHPTKMNRGNHHKSHPAKMNRGDHGNKRSHGNHH